MSRKEVEEKKLSIKNKNLDEEDDDDDEDDEDYVPDNEPESDKEDEKKLKNKRKFKSDDEELSQNSKDDDEITANKRLEQDSLLEFTESEKKKADELWSNFLRDTKSSATSTAQITNKTATTTTTVSDKINTQQTSSSMDKTSSRIFDSFKSAQSKTNEASKVAETKPSPIPIPKGAKPGGMASLLSKLNKEPKMSTLEKSKLDWDEFKKTEKIEEDLATHAKGKHSYLERKAFLERSDLRQFELEKEMRFKERRLRDNQK